jgi:MinD superfamily P-loop ATPase
MQQAFTIAFYSPVSGNGSSLLSLNLFDFIRHFLKEESIALVDCDISFPTLRYYLQTGKSESTDVNAEMPHINRGKCILCKVCGKACHFGAIKIQTSVGMIAFDERRCIACGACLNTCRHAAIETRNHLVGSYAVSDLQGKSVLLDANGDVPERFYVPVIQAMKLNAQKYGKVIIDAKPGLSAASLESIYGVDLLVLVADAGSFAGEYCNNLLPDLKKLSAKQCILINRCTGEPSAVREFAKTQNLPVIFEMPFNVALQLTGMNGEVAVRKFPEYEKAFGEIMANMQKLFQT